MEGGIHESNVMALAYRRVRGLRGRDTGCPIEECRYRVVRVVRGGTQVGPGDPWL